MKNDTKKKIISLAIIFGIIFGAIGSFYGISVLILGTTMPYSVVVSGSMKPTLNEGDILIIQHVQDGEIQKNDIIVFWAKTWGGLDPGTPVVHRVINITYSGESYYETKGDNNPTSDPLTPYHNVIGKVIFVIPYLGYPIYIFNTTTGKFFLYFLIGLTVIALIYVTLKDGDDKEKEDSEKEIMKSNN
ncbi:MAG: signal peptidase I [Candidatus Helarchaeota archaeon]